MPKDDASRRPVPPAGPPLYQVSKTAVPSGDIAFACKGNFTQHSRTEVLLARENSLQLYSEDLEPLGPMQPMFAMIQGLQVLHRDDCLGLSSRFEVLSSSFQKLDLHVNIWWHADC